MQITATVCAAMLIEARLELVPLKFVPTQAPALPLEQP